MSQNESEWRGTETKVAKLNLFASHFNVTHSSECFSKSIVLPHMLLTMQISAPSCLARLIMFGVYSFQRMSMHGDLPAS